MGARPLANGGSILVRVAVGICIDIGIGARVGLVVHAVIRACVDIAVGKVTVSNALPDSPCSPLGTVSATAPGIAAAQGIESARWMLEIEGIIKSSEETLAGFL